MDEPNLEDRPTPPHLKLDPALARPPTLLDRLMAHKALLAGVVALGLVVVVVSAVLLWAVAGDRLKPGSSGLKLEPPPSLEELVQQYPELEGLLNDPTLGSVYKEFIIAYEEGGAEAARELARLRGMLNDRDEIRVTLVLDSAEYVAPTVEELQRVGITVEGSYREKINVGVPLALIEQLAEQQGTDALFEQLTQMEHVIRLELPLPKRSDGVLRIEGEGVAIVGADEWHAAGFTGQSIRIGVLDLGFDGYRDLLGTELPASVVAKSFAYGVEADGSGVVHGTACAEIVHETAPDATLFLAYYDGTMVSEGQAVAWLLEQDVHIISHSAGSIMGPMDGTGDDAELADEVAAKGILWVNSAGNEGESHYRGTFTDTDGDGLHEFPDGDENIALWPYSSQLTIVLNWDDWRNVTEDHDFFLYDSQGNLVASAEDTQDGSLGQLAAEGLIFNVSSDEVHYLTIQAYETTRAATLDLYTVGTDIEFPVAEHSMNTPADARGALTVGATEYRDDSLASYSSQGPTNDGRLKPELTAPAGVSGATYGQDGFDGTSASTPYVSGAAALVWSAFPDFTREQVISYLESHSVDLGLNGPDNQFGYGRLQLPASPEGGTGATPPAELATLIPFATLIPELTEVATLVSFPTLSPETTVTSVEVPVEGGTLELPPPAEGRPGAGRGGMPSTMLLGGMGLVGLCGAAAALGGAALLLVAWRRSQQPALEPVLPPLAPLPPAPTPGRGSLTGAGLEPIPLRSGVTIIGRGVDTDVRLESHQASRRHARIECAGGQCKVVDLQSSNGTFVNGERVTQAVLSPGDRLRLGDVELTYRAAEIQPGRARLEISGLHYPVPDGGLTIGRSSDNALHLPDEVASRQHARIELQQGVFTLTDLNSANGTFVNGRRVREQRLQDGDEIRIGRNRMHFYIGERK